MANPNNKVIPTSPITPVAIVGGVKDALFDQIGPQVGQLAIVATGVAQVFGAGAIYRGLMIATAHSDNTSAITVGGAGVTNVVDGSGNGVIVEPGQQQIIFANNLNQLYANGTQDDVLSWTCAQ